MYQHPSIHFDLAKQRQADLLAEAELHRLAGDVERGPSEAVAVLKTIVSGVRSALAGRRPVVVREPRLQPSA